MKDGAAIRKVLKDASRFGLKDLGDENLFDLKKAFFRMVTPPEARPGDLIILKAPQSEGHTVLLRDRHVLVSGSAHELAVATQTKTRDAVLSVDRL